MIATRDRRASAVRAVRSALAQSHPVDDVLVVDDGSQPPLRLPPDLADHPAVRVMRLDPGRGRGVARNAGLRELRTPLVAFLDDDDLWHPDKTSVQLAALRAAGPRTAAVGSTFRLWHSRHCVTLRPAAVVRPADLLRCFGVCTSTVLARRAALLEVGGFAEDLERCEDWDLWVRLADRYEIAGVPDLLVEREDSRPAAAALHDSWVAMRGRLGPRIAALPPAQRATIEAEHDFMEGIHKARIGRRRAAARLLVAAWRCDPRRIRRLLHLGRLLTGERLWEGVAGAIRAGGRAQPLDRPPGELLRAQT